MTLFDFRTGDHATAVVRLFHARGMHLGHQNPSVYVLIDETVDLFSAVDRAYGELRLTRGLNMEVTSVPDDVREAC